MEKRIVIEDPFQADNRFQDGALAHISGVKSYQVLRANRAHPELAEGTGWTYNHAPMLAWAYGRFFLEYLSNPVSEHEIPGQTMLVSGTDGIHWDRPQVAFPPVEIPTAPYRGPKSPLLTKTILTCPHQRMGFYYSSRGVLLVLSFYGIVHDRKVSAPCDGWGVGRAVRRIREDGSLADEIRFLIYNEPAGFTKENVPVFGFFRDSSDRLLVEACEELLENGAVVRQMYEEQRFDQNLFPNKGAEALSFYTVSPTEMMGMYKKSLVSVSHDQGKTWTDPVREEDICTASGKVWGQKTSDGNYTLMYNPTTDGQHRWPIAAVTGSDGHHFRNMAAVTGEMSPQRYGGLDKNLGPQYMRGIAECNLQSPDGDVWLAYSNNKEDIWISRIPVPITSAGEKCGRIDFSKGIPRNLGIYMPAWCPVETCGGELILKDRDPYDLAAAEVNMAPAVSGKISLKLCIDRAYGQAGAVLSVSDRTGRLPILLVFGSDGLLRLRADGKMDPWFSWEFGKWMKVTLAFSGSERTCTVQIDGKKKTAGYNAAVKNLERIRIATKQKIPAASDLDSIGKYGTKDQVLAACEEPTEETCIRIRDLCWEQ